MKLKLTLDVETEQRFAYIAALFTEDEGTQVDLNHFASMMFASVLRSATRNPKAFGVFLNGEPAESPVEQQRRMIREQQEGAAELPHEPCAACGTLCDGSWSIEDEEGDERALCDHCGTSRMTIEATVKQIKKRDANRAKEGIPESPVDEQSLRIELTNRVARGIGDCHRCGRFQCVGFNPDGAGPQCKCCGHQWSLVIEMREEILQANRAIGRTAGGVA